MSNQDHPDGTGWTKPQLPAAAPPAAFRAGSAVKDEPVAVPSHGTACGLPGAPTSAGTA